jgi:hypothetical protein
MFDSCCFGGIEQHQRVIRFGNAPDLIGLFEIFAEELITTSPLFSICSMISTIASIIRLHLNACLE